MLFDDWVIQLARDAERRSKIVAADKRHVDSLHGQDRVDRGHGIRILNLRDRHRLGVRLLNKRERLHVCVS